MSLRVVMACPYSVSIPGGVQGQVLGLARALRRLGVEVSIVAPSDGPPPEAGIITVGASIPMAANGSVAPIAPDPAAAARTLRAVADEAPDVVHLHEPYVPGPCLTMLIAHHAPTVATFHAAGGFPLYRLAGPVLRRFGRRIDAPFAVSDEAAVLARRVTGVEPEVTFNGIDVSAFAHATPWPSSGPTIFFVGRHEPRKGLDVLVAAMDGLGDDVTLWVGGEGPQTAELQAQTADDDRIVWLGRLSAEELSRRLRGADVFCAPSLHGESFGIVLLEAMAAGTPIVAGDNPGYRKVARDGQDALLVPPGDPQSLMRALDRLLTDGDLAERLVESGERRAATFSMDVLAQRYLERYRQLVR